MFNSVCLYFQWTNDGDKLLCQCNSSIQVLNLNEGKVGLIIGTEDPSSDEGDGDLLVSFVLSPDNASIVSAHKNGLFKLWNLNDGKLIKHWRTIHKGPVSKLALTSDSSLLASGGSDSSIRIWNLKHHACTHNLQGSQGVISVLRFYERENKNILVFGAGDDATIKAWNLTNGHIITTLSGHFSKVTGLEFHPSGKYIISCGRDKVLILWDFETGKQIKILPLYESVEALALLPEKLTVPGKDQKVSGGVYVAVAGIVRLWDALNATELYVQNNSLIGKSDEDGGLSVTKLLFNPSTSSIAIASTDHNIIIHELDTFSCKKQLIGFTDEVLDIVIIGPKECHMAVATNSTDIKLYNRDSMNCQLLRGHTDLVVALSSTPANLCLFASASKDNSIRVWLLKDESAYCICSGMKHNNSVGDVALSQMKELNVKLATIAHEKDINCVAISPNDKLISTASLDKTAKLWSSDDLSLLGVLKGHKRSVWSCTFSPIDQVLLTTSADTTLKLWSLSDLSCLKTLEGHDSSVLRGHFLSRGTQILSVGGDGLVKLWCIKSGECVASFDGHDAKIWALSVTRDESHFVTGSCDSKVIVWQDATEETRLEKAAAAHERILQEQRLANLLQSNDLLSALKLALTLDRPATVFKIIQGVIKSGSDGLCDTIKQLETEEKNILLKFATSWNTNSKYCYAAQFLLSILLDDVATGIIKPSQSTVESLIPFTERHFSRLTQLLQELHFLNYTKTIMQPVVKNIYD
ncbi:hypothetical protein AAG570_011761 [Ranatra chinensis]|uniref:U3 small nucleolar RNA-associated protein 13 C-terminal domain-containing protein n=1 Tax=Ranatra chinensis TaxID=642074 RepID=A0ABD0YGV1_9HEMI